MVPSCTQPVVDMSQVRNHNKGWIDFGLTRNTDAVITRPAHGGHSIAVHAKSKREFLSGALLSPLTNTQSDSPLGLWGHIPNLLAPFRN
jgi:hypothetical protein